MFIYIKVSARNNLSLINLSCFVSLSFYLFFYAIFNNTQQVINTIKSKHYSYNGFEQQAINGVKVLKRQRNARKFSYSDENIQRMTNVLASIENMKN